MPPTLQDSALAFSTPSCRPHGYSRWGKYCALCSDPSCCVGRGGTELSTAAQSNDEDITLGVLGPCPGCMHLKCAGGSSGWGSRRVRAGPRKERVHPTLGAGLLAGSVLPTGWGQELARHSMSFPVAGQHVHVSGTRERRQMAWMPPSCAAAGKATTTVLGP